MRKTRGRRACDLGAGNGRHVWLLAASGFDVLAIERDVDTARQLRRTVKQFALPVRVQTADASSVTGSFDLICATNLLHLMPSRARDRLVMQLRRCTTPGGVNVVTAFTTGAPSGVPAPLRRGQLRRLYRGWDVLAYREWWTRPLCYDGATAISFPYAAIIARRPPAGASPARGTQRRSAPAVVASRTTRRRSARDT